MSISTLVRFPYGITLHFPSKLVRLGPVVGLLWSQVLRLYLRIVTLITNPIPQVYGLRPKCLCHVLYKPIFTEERDSPVLFHLDVCTVLWGEKKRDYVEGRERLCGLQIQTRYFIGLKLHIRLYCTYEVARPLSYLPTTYF